jgi:hypothetical protein
MEATATATHESAINRGLAPNSLSAKKPGRGHLVVPSAAVIAVILFIGLFLFLTQVTANRVRIDALVRNISVDRWCHRFEKYLVSGANPDIVVIGSSTALVPSEMCDVAFHVAPKLPDVVALQSYSEHYEAPLFFLQCLSCQGFTHLSVLNLAVPTADVEDESLLIKQLISFRKKPKLIILAIGPRDFAVLPSNDAPSLGSPIFRCLGDIKPPAENLVRTRIVPWLVVNLRSSALARIWDDQKYYFSYELMRLVRPAKQAIEKYVPVAAHLPDYKEANSQFVSEAWSLPSQVKIDLSPMDHMLANYNPDFVNKQALALEKSAKLLQSNGIKLVIVETPMCVGIDYPKQLNDKYCQSTESVCRSYGAKWLRPAVASKFEMNDFSDPVHMNAFGGYKWFTCTSKFISDHRRELLQ